MLPLLRFHPYLRPMVWGGRRLGELRKELPGADAYGESWEVSDHTSHVSVLVDPAGVTLRDLMARHRTELLGEAEDRHDVFPWLVKFLDARDWLSVQVHPDDDAALHLWPGERGKTEAWVVLDSTPDSRIYAGLRPGVDAACLRHALATGTVTDYLHQFLPRPGDCLFLPAGTVHAVGGGVLLAEVQQTSDATFRLHDWDRRDAQGRSRPLHIDASFACIDWQSGPRNPVPILGFPSPGTRAPDGEVTQQLVVCPFFVLDYARRSQPFSLGGSGRLQVAIVVHGRGELQQPGGPAELQIGDTLVVPAASAPTTCLPGEPLGLLIASLP
jgi:mannose-6-phosphate isomerase